MNKTELIAFDEIIGFKTNRLRTRRGASISDGYLELEVHLTNDRAIFFNADQFENFNEIKYHILINQKEE